MSHRYSKLRFTNGLNVLVGRRGSGKTAVLEAIRLLFGGLGRERASTLKEFIKHGASKAVIRARIRNGIYVPGRSWIRFIETLPDSADITLERVIFSDGRSVFKLNGKTVPRQDVVKILSKANISARNHLFFLPQERVNDWVRLNSRERIELLLSALGLKELKEKIDLVKEEVSSKKKEKEKYLKMLEEWERVIREKEKDLLPPRVARDRLMRYYILKLAYLVSRKIEIERDLERLHERLRNIDSEIEENRQLMADIERKKEEISAKITALKEEWERLIFKEKIGYEYELNETEKKINNYQAKLNEIREKYERELSELEEIKRVWGTHDPEELRSLIDDKRLRIEQINEMLSGDRDIAQIRELESELDDLLEEKTRLIRELDEAREGLKQILRRLDPKGDLENIFFKLQEKRIPDIYGPLIFEIKLRLSISKIREYGGIVEHALGHRFLSSFIALSSEGYREALKIIKAAKNPSSFDVFTFSRPGEMRIVGSDPYGIVRKIVDEARKQRQHLKRLAEKVLGDRAGLIVFWLCDIIDGSLPALALIESRNWNVPVVVDNLVAAEIMDKLHINRAITITGEIIERRISPLTKHVIYSTKTIPIDDNENIFTHLAGFDFNNFKRLESEILTQISDINEEIQKLRREIKFLREHLPERVRVLDAEKRRLEEEILELRNVISRAETIRSRLEKLPEDRKKILKTVEVLQARIDELSDKISEIENRANEIKAEIDQLEKEKEEITTQYSEYIAKLRSLERDREELPARIRGLEREKSQVDEEIEQIKREILAIFEILRRLGEYPPDSNLDEIIEREILKPAENLLESITTQELHEELAFLEKQAQNLRENIFRMETRLEEIEEILSNIRRYQEKIREIDAEIEEIRRLYERELEEIINQLHSKVALINKNYQRILKTLGAKGEVKVKGDSIDNLELSITIDLHRSAPVEIDKGGFSSGEKSTAIMALILSMMLTSPTPIYMFDEFDVYLDDKSLLDVMKLIKENLKDFQGIITTTHRDEILSSADLIYYLEFDDKEKATKILLIDVSALEKQ